MYILSPACNGITWDWQHYWNYLLYCSTKPVACCINIFTPTRPHDLEQCFWFSAPQKDYICMLTKIPLFLWMTIFWFWYGSCKQQILFSILWTRPYFECGIFQLGHVGSANIIQVLGQLFGYVYCTYTIFLICILAVFLATVWHTQPLACSSLCVAKPTICKALS